MDAMVESTRKKPLNPNEMVVSQFATGTWVMLSDLGIEFDWSEIQEGE